jgi:DNA gyrase subunit A
VEGLVRAIQNIDAIVALIKAAASPQVAREQLQAKFSFSEKQAQAILDLRLHRLTSLERNKLEEELLNLKKRIVELKEVLASEAKLMAVIRQELVEIREKYTDKRRTEILALEGEELNLEDLTEDAEVILTFSHEGYIKRMPTSEFQAQNRGGKGIIGLQTKEDDLIRQMYVATTHGNLLCLTNNGRIYKLKVYEVPEASRTARGKNIVNLIQLAAGEKVQNIIHTREFKEGEFLVLLTKKGTIKKTDMMEFANLRVTGKAAISLAGEDDALVGSRICRSGQDLLICTENGKLIRFSEEDVRAMGTTAMGVRGISLSDGDNVVGLEVCDDSSSLLTVTELGYGKQTPVSEYRKTGRGGMGVITLKVTEKTGKIVSVLQVKSRDEVMVMSDGGKMIRTAVQNISEMGRNTQGVRVMSLNEGEKVAAVTLIEAGTDGGGNSQDPVLH